ncbi:ATP-binding cassette domain-containing protein [Humibacter ginsengiterrae]
MSGGDAGLSADAARLAGALEPVVSMRGISKSFGHIQALRNVDLDLYGGEVVALVGDNGAGKSTLVKILAGVHPPDSGSIAYEGRTVSIPTPAASRELGIATVFQDLALCDNLDVVANLFLGQELGNGPLDEEAMEQRSWELLRQLSARIPSVRMPVATLSGGQRQTVAIARSLIGEPSVVILDEPTAALGVAQTAEVLNLIELLRDRGHCVVLISHNMADVQAVADRVIVLRLGRVNGRFRAPDLSYEDIIASITGVLNLEEGTPEDDPRDRLLDGPFGDAGAGDESGDPPFPGGGGR